MIDDKAIKEAKKLTKDANKVMKEILDRGFIELENGKRLIVDKDFKMAFVGNSLTLSERTLIDMSVLDKLDTIFSITFVLLDEAYKSVVTSNYRDYNVIKEHEDKIYKELMDKVNEIYEKHLESKELLGKVRSVGWVIVNALIRVLKDLTIEEFDLMRSGFVISIYALSKMMREKENRDVI